MYARVTTMTVDLARLAALPAKLKELAPASKALPGVVDVYFTWRGDGQVAVMAVFSSKADAEAAAPKIQAILSSLAPLLKGPPNIGMFDNVEHLAG
jgi:quinol monooxygenase YgiN